MAVRVNFEGVKKKLRRIASDKRVGRFVASTAERLMQPYVPERAHYLIRSSKVSPFAIVYTMPYAHYQWNGVSKSGKKLNWIKTTATSHWEKRVDKDQLARDVTAYLKRL